MRIAALVTAACIQACASRLRGEPIHQMFSDAYRVTVVGAFVRWLFASIESARRHRGGEWNVFGIGIGIGIGIWPPLLGTSAARAIPVPPAGLIALVVGMTGGTLMPQAVANRPR